jgi:hypothetical protein
MGATRYDLPIAVVGRVLVWSMKRRVQACRREWILLRQLDMHRRHREGRALGRSTD